MHCWVIEICISQISIQISPRKICRAVSILYCQSPPLLALIRVLNIQSGNHFVSRRKFEYKTCRINIFWSVMEYAKGLIEVQYFISVLEIWILRDCLEIGFFQEQFAFTRYTDIEAKEKIQLWDHSCSWCFMPPKNVLFIMMSSLTEISWKSDGPFQK